MDRVHLSKLTNEQIGENIPGWFFITDLDGQIPVFQCQCGFRGELTGHSIDRKGEVNASILCPNNDFHVMGILDAWDDNSYKLAGDRIVRYL